MKKIYILLLLLPTLLTAAGQDEVKIGIYEKLDSYIPSDLQFTNDRGEIVQLSSIIDKPTVLSLVYYNCPGICSPLLDGVAQVIDRSDMVLGKDYQVLTISFNWEETWQLGSEKKVNYLAQVKKEVDESSWIWMAGDSVNVTKLVESVGFGFQKDGKDYIHAAAIMLLSPEGKITRYLYGTYFLPFDLKLAVVEAAQGKSGPTINKVLKYCFSYDAEGKKYVFNITKVSATVILFFALTLFLYLVFSRKKRIKRDY
jgi:protein SCO1